MNHSNKPDEVHPLSGPCTVKVLDEGDGWYILGGDWPGVFIPDPALIGPDSEAEMMSSYQAIFFGEQLEE